MKKSLAALGKIINVILIIILLPFSLIISIIFGTTKKR
jgi:capsule polysaccharide export protein KpsE/RkpR